MRRRWRIVVVLVAVAGMATWMLWPGKPEPSSQGRTLSEWLGQRRPVAFTRRPVIRLTAEAEDAIRHMGTNAVPWLLEWTLYDSEPGRQRRDRLYRKLPQRILRSSFGRWLISETKQERQAAAALEGFRALSPEAASAAIPELGRRLHDPKLADEPWRRAVEALSVSGNAGTTVLLLALTDPTQRDRDRVAKHLRLSDRWTAATLRVVDDYDRHREAAVAFMVQMALFHFTPDDAAEMRYLTNALRSTDSHVRQYATNWLVWKSLRN